MAEERENNVNDVHFDSWDELLEALEKDYTTSFKDVCRAMKASRAWTNRYIRPFIKSVYVRNNRRGEGFSGINWIKIAATKLQRDMTESIWFNTAEFNSYIVQSVSSVTKQTKRIPKTYFIPGNLLEQFHTEREELRTQMKNAGVSSWMKLNDRYQELWNEYIPQDEAVKELFEAHLGVTERTKAPAVSVPLPDGFMQKWKAPHEMKDYGDADETLYRDMFANGYIRIEVRLPDENGEIGQKIFYMPDPDSVHAKYEEEGCICIPVEKWNEFLERKGRK